MAGKAGTDRATTRTVTLRSTEAMATTKEGRRAGNRRVIKRTAALTTLQTTYPFDMQ